MHCRSPSISEMAVVGLDSSGTPGYPMSFPSCFILSFPVLSLFVFLKKKSRIHNLFILFFWGPKILTPNTLNINVHKMYECDKNQMPYWNIKCYKKYVF